MRWNRSAATSSSVGSVTEFIGADGEAVEMGRRVEIALLAGRGAACDGGKVRGGGGADERLDRTGVNGACVAGWWILYSARADRGRVGTPT